MMLVSKMLGMKKIILLSVIIHCVQFFHLNSTKCPHNTKSCVVVNVAFLLKSVHSSLLSWRDRYLKKLEDKIQNSQSRRSGDKENHIYETYKNTMIPHGHHIYAKSSDMANTTMCAYPHSDHALPHWKCVLGCCADCPCINLTEQEKKIGINNSLNLVSHLSHHWTLYYSWQNSTERQENILYV